MPSFIPSTLVRVLSDFMPSYSTAISDRTNPLEWLYRLEVKLNNERVGCPVRLQDGYVEWQIGLDQLDAYYRGNHPLPEIVDAETRRRYLEFMRRSRSNYMAVVVDSEAERIHWNGVRLGADKTAEPDAELWELLQRNGVDTDFSLATQTALTQRRAYWSVWYPAQRGGDPVIRVEDPAQVIVEHEPGDRSKRAAALKLWYDDWDGSKLANVYLPNWTYRFRWHDGDAVRPSGWYEREAPLRNPLGVVPIIPMVNRPSLNRDPDGRSEIDGLTVIQDRINQTDLNRQVAEHFAAFRQKWATGLDIPTDENGDPVAPFKSAIDSFWVSSSDKAKWGEFEATNLQNYDYPKQGDIQDIAIISATPRHYFTVNGQAPSGDSIKSAESGLIAKCVAFQRETGNPAISEIVNLVRRVQDLPPEIVTPVWGDPEYRTFSQLVDGTAKLVESRLISLRYGRELIGMDPLTAERMEQEIEDEYRAMQSAGLIPSNADPAEGEGESNNQE